MEKAKRILKPLGEVTEFMTKGIAPKYTENETENTIKVLNQRCNRNFQISYKEARLHDKSLRKVSEEKLLKPGDVLINSTGTGTAGRVAQVWQIPATTTFDGHMILLRPTKEIDPLYYGYAIKAQQKQIESLAEGSTGQTEINRKRLQEEIIINFPINISKQRKVGMILFNIDKRIKINAAINDNLQQQAVAIFRSWFVDYIPFGGTAPDKWENVTLEDITALVSRGITPKYADDTGQIVINQKCIRNHMIDLSFARAHRPKVINDKWLRFGDLLINSTGNGTLGRAAQVWFQPHNLTVDSHVTIVRPATESMIFYIGLWGTQHEKEIESLHIGSTGQTELPRDRVKALELLLPDKETLDCFNALIAPMAAAIVSNQEENNRLASIRDELLPKLMSGKIDVSAIQL